MLVVVGLRLLVSILVLWVGCWNLVGFHGETDWVLFLFESLGFRWMIFMDSLFMGLIVLVCGLNMYVKIDDFSSAILC